MRYDARGMGAMESPRECRREHVRGALPLQMAAEPAAAASKA